MTSKYCIGIDLGTTNSVLAYAPLDEDQPRVERAAGSATGGRRHGRIADHAAVVSVSRPASTKPQAGRFDLPWAAGPRISPWANSPGARRPKCPTAPWARPSRGSATAASIAASRSCPGTRRPRCRRSRRSRPRSATWNTWSPPGNAAFPDAPLAEQHRRAHRARLVRRQRPRADPRGGPGRRTAAGPGAAWKSRRRRSTPGWPTTGERWRRLLKVGDTLLVCDVGGGTTDLTLVGVAEEHGELVLRADRRGQSSAGRRRQHGPGPGPLRGRPVRRKGREARSLAIGRPVAFVPRGQGNAARARRPGKTQHRRARPRPQADRRHGLDRSRSPRA